MNIFRRLFNIGKAEASTSFTSSEPTDLIAEGEKELIIQKEKLAGLQKEGSAAAAVLAQNITEWESILETVKKKTVAAKPGNKTQSFADKAKSQLLDRDGDGNVMDDIGGMIGHFGK